MQNVSGMLSPLLVPADCLLVVEKSFMKEGKKVYYISDVLVSRTMPLFLSTRLPQGLKQCPNGMLQCKNLWSLALRYQKYALSVRGSARLASGWTRREIAYDIALKTVIACRHMLPG